MPKIKDDFEARLLEKTTGSDDWFLVALNPGSLNNQTEDLLLYNNDWLIACKIDPQKLLIDRLGEYNYYFSQKIIVANKTIYSLLTWSPSRSIYYKNAGAILVKYLMVFLSSGAFLGLIMLFISMAIDHDSERIKTIIQRQGLLHIRELEKSCFIINGVWDLVIFPWPFSLNKEVFR